MSLYGKVAEFHVAGCLFNSCPEMLMSHGQLSDEAQEISNRFFGLRSELTEIGLGFNKRGRLQKLEAAVLCWAVWQQAASYTATLTLSGQSTAEIMRQLAFAEQRMFDALSEK